MGKFSDNLDLRWDHVESGNVFWMLLTQLSYTSDDGRIFIIPAGFVTDLASIPRVFWPILPPFWRYSKAAVLHDYLLVTKKMNFYEANSMMKEAMRSLDVNETQLWIIYISISGWARVKLGVIEPIKRRVDKLRN